METPMAMMKAEIERVSTRDGVHKFTNYWLNAQTADGLNRVVAHIVGNRHEIDYKSNETKLYIYGTKGDFYLGAFVVQDIEIKERTLNDNDNALDDKGSSGAVATECGSGAPEVAAR